MIQFVNSCLDAVRRISEHHDAPLRLSARIGLWLHLVVCSHCRRYKRQLELLRSFLRDYPDQLARVKLPAEARAEIVRRLRGQS